MSLRVESTERNFTSRLLSEPYVTVSRHTALGYTFDARNIYQCANKRGLSPRICSSLRAARRFPIRYLLLAHFRRITKQRRSSQTGKQQQESGISAVCAA